MRTKYLLLVLLLTAFFNTKLSAQVYINEFLASNALTNPDIKEFDDYSDWIELYNGSDKEINLSGWHVTDNLNKPAKWEIKDIVLAPKSFVIIWADGFDNSTSKLNKHATFKLSREGEEIGLFNETGQLIDKITFGYQLTDVSYGRQPEGSDNWCYFGEPTPNNLNLSEGIKIPDYTTSPVFSELGGYNSTPLSLSLSSTNIEANIHYTTDCSLPTQESPLFEYPIIIDSTTIIRARCYQDGLLPSEIITNSYFFNEENNNLPTISLTAFPETLWGNEIGIYKNSIKGMEIPTNIEYFDSDNKPQINQLTDARISGQASYAAPQKPFTISAKGKFGEDFLSYPFFNSRKQSQYKDIYLRNSGTPDAFHTMFRDGFTHSIMVNKLEIDCQAYQPAKVFLNGKYWGIYNIREKINADYLTNIHGANRDNLNILEYGKPTNPSALEGDNEDFLRFWFYIENLSMEVPKNYEYVKSNIDIDEFIDYQIAEIYIDNLDWGSSNMQWWKENTYDSKWRWIMLDTDVSFGLKWATWAPNRFQSYYYHDNLERAITDMTQAYLFRRLLANKEFKNEFIGRFAAHLNTTFSSIHTLGLIDSLEHNIYNEMPKHIERWKDFTYSYYGEPIADMEDWQSEVDIMKEFALKRPDYQRAHLISNFNLTGMNRLHLAVASPKMGSININDIFITDSTSTGLYFNKVPLRIKAIPKLGYKFTSWGDGGANPDTFLSLTKETQLVAQFEPETISIIPPLINETYSLYKSKSPYYTKGDITINANASLQIEPGVEIKMANNASFYVHGNIRALGTENEGIVIKPNFTSGAENWGNLCFENPSSHSELNYLVLENSTNPHKNEKHFSCISAYNTLLLINHVSIDSKAQPFYSEYGEIEIYNSFFHSDIASDLINIKYARTAIVENCTLLGNESVDADAIDYDNLNSGIIRGNYISGFTGFNSDGIDLGEDAKNILIDNNIIFSCADKGISIGQSSTAIVKNNIIAYCNQGLGIKDEGSYALIDKNTFYGNFYAVACFEKNFRAGGGKADLKNSIISNSIGSSIFVDSLSSITTSYTLSDDELLVGTKNIHTNPNFKDEAIFNFELAENSPCLNAGDPSSALDSDGTITDMGALSLYSNTEYGKVIINEINYNSDTLKNSDDWIELYNASNTVIDLSGYSFLDEKNDHIFTLPDGIRLEEKEYFVLCKNDSAFKATHPYVPNYFGNFEFGLSNNGELIRLFDARMNLINSVTYANVTPWPTEPDGNGYTLELISEELDNTKPANWRKSPFLLGSPGKSNNPTILADFNYEIYSDCSGLVYFINTTEGPYDSIRWDFGDGTTDATNSVEHVYNKAGTYSAALTVYSYFGTSTSQNNLVFQNTMTQPIVAGDTVCSEGYLTLTAEGSHRMLWFTDRFDGDAIYEGRTYNTELLKATQTLYVSNNFGSCESNRVAVVAKVYKNVLSYFIYELNNGLLTTKNVSKDGMEYLWDFGDGITSSEFEPTHQYTENGTYTVKLTANNLFCATTNTSLRTMEVLNVNINDYQFSSLVAVYPNPSTGIINLDFKQEFITPATIKIYNLYGQLIDTKMLNTSNNSRHSFDLSSKPKGIYIIMINVDDQPILKKVIIQ